MRAAKAKASLCIGLNLADNQQEDSIDVVYESGARRFHWCRLRTSTSLLLADFCLIYASSEGSGDSVHWHKLDWA